MKEKVFALINNHNGLSDQQKSMLSQLGCEIGSVCNVKEIILKGDSFDVVCDVYTAEITLSSDNVRLYKSFGDDIKYYDPLQDKDLNSQKQRGE